MQNKLYNGIIFIFISILLSSCAKEPPKCSDEETVGLIKQIILDHITKIAGGEGISKKEIEDNVNIESSRASSFDEKIKKYTCDATLNGTGMKLPIKYESQLDDNGQHLVSVYDIDTVAYISRAAVLTSRASRNGSNDNSTVNTSKKTTLIPPDDLLERFMQTYNRLGYIVVDENGQDRKIRKEDVHYDAIDINGDGKTDWFLGTSYFCGSGTGCDGSVYLDVNGSYCYVGSGNSVALVANKKVFKNLACTSKDETPIQ